MLSLQGPLPLCPAGGGVGRGLETRRGAGTGTGASLPFSWKAKQALNPFLVEPALPDAQGAVVSGVPFPPSPFLRCSRAKPCPCVPDFCRASLESAAGPRQPPLPAGTPQQRWHSPAHQRSQFRSGELFHSSPASASACARAPVLLIPPLLWRRAAVGWGRQEPASLGTGWGCPCVTPMAGRPGSGWGGEAELLWQWLV